MIHQLHWCRLGTLLCFSLTVLPACKTAPSSVRLIGGSGDQAGRFTGVLSLVWTTPQGGEETASAVLMEDGSLLTAAHALDRLAARQKDSLWLLNDGVLLLKETHMSSVAIATMNDATPNSLSPERFGTDLGRLRLDSSIVSRWRSNLRPLQLAVQPPRVGDPIIIVGTGRDESGRSGERRFAANTIAHVHLAGSAGLLEIASGQSMVDERDLVTRCIDLLCFRRHPPAVGSQASTAPGDSGAAILDASGALLGLNVGGNGRDLSYGVNLSDPTIDAWLASQGLKRGSSLTPTVTTMDLVKGVYRSSTGELIYDVLAPESGLLPGSKNGGSADDGSGQDDGHDATKRQTSQPPPAKRNVGR